MKNNLKTFFVLMIISSVSFPAYGQRRASKTPPPPPVPALDSSRVMTMIKDNSLFYNVRQFGAKGDSATIDTEAINKAIDAAVSAGGGTVYFPAGNYLSFSIHLKSNITIFLDNGAYLIGAVPQEGKPGYDPPEPNPTDMYQDFGHSHWHNSLIWGENLDNIAITGHGWIVGQRINQGRQDDSRALAIRQLP